MIKCDWEQNLGQRLYKLNPDKRKLQKKKQEKAQWDHKKANSVLFY